MHEIPDLYLVIGRDKEQDAPINIPSESPSSDTARRVEPSKVTFSPTGKGTPPLMSGETQTPWNGTGGVVFLGAAVTQAVVIRSAMEGMMYFIIPFRGRFG
jgi:hypothetical protein